ncbi:ABC transporter permease [Anoxybacter fermentans]|uniref:ABC transporter permease n=1 Tax=Anoxybacter fermentans TaxID=1323375 RepID=A0A3Q9HQ14_9FIRM|nr:ABC transporter permease subunit [Anoxybacter fermentans]AZR72862.1 ABC transporter permease [Anoxybacter fermentans]
MSKTFTIFKREFRSYFLSMSAYVFIGFYLLIIGYFFSSFVLSTRLAELRPIINNMAIIFIFVSPLLTMRLWAEEKKGGTDQLLLTAPARISSLVLGKFFASLAVFVVILVITLEFPITLGIFGSPDLGPIFTGYLGLLLLGAACIAVGNFASSLTENQIIAGVISFGLLLLFWVFSWADEFLPRWIGTFLSNLSILTHYFDFTKGIIDLGHVVYYLSFIFFWLFLTGLNLERKRWS